MTAIYDKYKPKTLGEHNFNYDIVETLHKLIEIDSLNVLIVGTEGTGKSLLANNAISEYYRQHPPDIFTISTLTDHGSVFTRDMLKTFCQTRSSSNLKKTVLIENFELIQEPHQYTIRTIIDKFGHLVNIVGVAESTNRIIESIQSRLITLQCHPPTRDCLLRIMRNIIKHEEIHITKHAIDHILQSSNFSVNKMINYIEKCAFLKQNVTYNCSVNLCDGIHYKHLDLFTQLCQESNRKDASDIIIRIYKNGYSILDIMHEYFHFLKITDTIAENEKYQTIPIICKFIHMFYEVQEHEIELVFFTQNIINILHPISSPKSSNIILQ